MLRDLLVPFLLVRSNIVLTVGHLDTWESQLPLDLPSLGPANLFIAFCHPHEPTVANDYRGENAMIEVPCPLVCVFLIIKLTRATNDIRA